MRKSWQSEGLNGEHRNLLRRGCSCAPSFPEFPTTPGYRGVTRLGQVVNALAMAARYDPDPSQFLGIRLPEGAVDSCSSVMTLKSASWLGPQLVDRATSVASRPRAVSIRPIRG